VRECGRPWCEGGDIRGKKTEGGGHEDLGPPMLLAVMPPPGGAEHGKKTRDCCDGGL
jgi:hypothetical protein